MGKIRIQRGDVYLADLSPVIGSEQGGMRPVLIIQNDVGNRYSPTTIVAAITSQLTKSTLPTHVKIKAAESGIACDSIILLEQLQTIDKRRLKKHLTRFDDRIMKNVDHALHISLNLS
jgi:mRNA interferase MazF